MTGEEEEYSNSPVKFSQINKLTSKSNEYQLKDAVEVRRAYFAEE